MAYLAGMPTTTIKVPVELRDRVASHVDRAELPTMAAVIERALDRLDADTFYADLERSRAATAEDPAAETYCAEFDDWEAMEQAGNEILPDEEWPELQ